MTLSVLAVDDSRTIREMIKLTLDDAGYSTLLAEDGQDGLEVLTSAIEQNAPPDAIITDINMPRLDGIGFIKALRQLDNTRMIPVLVLSTESSDNLKRQARAAGATGWIVKPFDPAKLIKGLQMVAGST